MDANLQFKVFAALVLKHMRSELPSHARDDRARCLGPRNETIHNDIFFLCVFEVGLVENVVHSTCIYFFYFSF